MSQSTKESCNYKAAPKTPAGALGSVFQSAVNRICTAALCLTGSVLRNTESPPNSQKKY